MSVHQNIQLVGDYKAEDAFKVINIDKDATFRVLSTTNNNRLIQNIVNLNGHFIEEESNITESAGLIFCVIGVELCLYLYTKSNVIQTIYGNIGCCELTSEKAQKEGKNPMSIYGMDHSNSNEYMLFSAFDVLFKSRPVRVFCYIHYGKTLLGDNRTTNNAFDLDLYGFVNVFDITYQMDSDIKKCITRLSDDYVFHRDVFNPRTVVNCLSQLLTVILRRCIMGRPVFIIQHLNIENELKKISLLNK